MYTPTTARHGTVKFCGRKGEVMEKHSDFTRMNSDFRGERFFKRYNPNAEIQSYSDRKMLRKMRYSL